MKKIGEYTIRGSYTPNGGFNFDNPKMLQLFDGRFDTGYRVTSFIVWGIGIDAGQDNDILALLTTEDLGSGVLFDAGDNRQVGWAANKGATYADVNGYSRGIIDPDNMIIEDLFFYGFSGDQGTSKVNYLITLDKYDITDWQGALSMVRNKSQA